MDRACWLFSPGLGSNAGLTCARTPHEPTSRTTKSCPSDWDRRRRQRVDLTGAVLVGTTNGERLGVACSADRPSQRRRWAGLHRYRDPRPLQLPRFVDRDRVDLPRRGQRYLDPVAYVLDHSPGTDDTSESPRRNLRPIRGAGVAAVGSAGPQEHPREVRWMDPDTVRKHPARTTCLASSGEYSADLGSSVL
jgi:hypothetical protein